MASGPHAAWGLRSEGAPFAFGSIDCCCGDVCRIVICVRDCFGFLISGAVVTIKSSGTTIATCTTGGDSCCTLAIDSPGDYEVIVTKTGYYTYEAVTRLDCNQTVSVKLKRTTEQFPVEFIVIGCCNQPLNGATVTLDGISHTTALTTGGNGTTFFGMTKAGTFAWSVSKDRFVTQTGTVTLVECGAGKRITVNLEPAGGYHCGFGLADPVADTLFLTDSVWGGTTAVWIPNVNYCGFTSGWKATIAASYPATDLCPATTATIMYFFQDCPGSIIGACSYLSFPVSGCVNCFDGFFVRNLGTAITDGGNGWPCPPTGDSHATLPVPSRVSPHAGDCGGVDSATQDPTIPLHFVGTWGGSTNPCSAPNRGAWPVDVFTITVTE
jgi:hypothetical protein